MALTKLQSNGIAAAAITSAALAPNTITADDIADGSITDNKLVTPPFSTGKAIAMSIVFS